MKGRLGVLIGCMAVGLFLGAAAEADENQGFIYGTVVTTSGNTYKGILRWGREEYFWGDLFNGAKDEMPYRERDYWDRDDSRRDRHRDRRRIRVFGVTVGYDWNDDNRHFVARFGDIQKVEIYGRERITLTMRNGERYELDGGSNDIGARITVHDESLGDVRIDWKKIEQVTFSAVPPGTPVPARRLFGKLTTEDGQEFEGFIQWDLHECIWTDELDGESEDGDVEIEMGKIRTIEKRDRRGAWVTLKDGRRMLLEDTNDVDHSTSGTFVENPRFGRVRVRWDEFKKVEFEDTARTGPGYDDFAPAKKLTGTVTDRDGKSHTGRIVFDLDESETFEMLEGDERDLEYSIPFELVKRIEPDGWDGSTVVLKSGIELRLEDSTDVSDDNAGVLIFQNDEETYLAWRDVRKIELD